MFSRSIHAVTFWPSDSTSGNISEGTQSTNSKEHKHLYVHCSVIYNCQDMEAAQCLSVDEWVKQLWNIYTMEFYLAVKKKKIFSWAKYIFGRIFKTCEFRNGIWLKEVIEGLG